VNDNRRIRYFLSGALALALLPPAVFLAQDRAQDSSAEKSKASDSASNKALVVNVPVTVRDKHGKIVNNLTKDDFVLQEDGRFQDIRYFAPESEQPLTIGLVVDTSPRQRRTLGEERDASSSFLDQILRPEKDKAFLIHFDHEVDLDQDVTSSREKLHSGLQSLQTPQFSQSGNNNPSDQDSQRHGGGRYNRGGGTMLYDAVFLASDEILKKQGGHKAIVVLSNGVDRGSKEGLMGAIAAAQRADTIVYSVFFKPESSFGGERGGGGPFGGGMGGHRGGGRRRYPQEQQTDGKKILQQISQETGGRLFEVSGKDSVQKIYAQIQEDLRNQYSVGYTPDRVMGNSGYHKIDLKTKKKDLEVEARAGYYAE
jgi:VWFA-related protein